MSQMWNDIELRTLPELNVHEINPDIKALPHELGRIAAGDLAFDLDLSNLGPAMASLQLDKEIIRLGDLLPDETDVADLLLQEHRAGSKKAGEQKLTPETQAALRKPLCSFAEIIHRRQDDITLPSQAYAQLFVRAMASYSLPGAAPGTAQGETSWHTDENWATITGSFYGPGTETLNTAPLSRGKLASTEYLLAHQDKVRGYVDQAPTGSVRMFTGNTDHRAAKLGSDVPTTVPRVVAVLHIYSKKFDHMLS